MTEESTGTPCYYAHRLDDGDPKPLTILAAVEEIKDGVAWGRGYSEMVPGGEYGTFPPEALTRELSAEVFEILLRLVRSDDAEAHRMLAICAESLPLLRLDVLQQAPLR